MESGVMRVFEFPEMQPVKPDQAILRAQPDEAVPGLKNRVYGGLKEPFLLAPDTMRVLRQAFDWIER
jgi:hypothetical protein